MESSGAAIAWSSNIRISILTLCLANAVGCGRQHDSNTLDAGFADAAVDTPLDAAMADAAHAAPRPHTDERFVLLRGSEERGLNRLIELDLGRERQQAWIERAPGEGALEHLVAGGGTAVVTWRAGREERSVRVFRGGEPIALPALTNPLRYDTSSVGSTLLFTADEVVVMDEHGRERGRWPYPFAHPIIDPRHRWLLHHASAGLSLFDLSSGATRQVRSPGRSRPIERAWFGPDEVIVEFESAAPDLRYVAFDLLTAPTSARALDLHGLVVADYDRCRGRLLTLGAFGDVVSVHVRTGAREQLVARVGLRPLTAGARPALAVLSPDGRSLIWLAGRAPEWRAIVVADLLRGAAVALPDPTLPYPTLPRSACDGCADSIEVGRFASGFLSLGASSRRWGSAAYRVQLRPPAMVRLPHCGRTTPWVLGDGAVLVCQGDGETRLGAARPGAGFYPLTDGPVDVSVTPLHATPLGCAARSPW